MTNATKNAAKRHETHVLYYNFRGNKFLKTYIHQIGVAMAQQLILFCHKFTIETKPICQNMYENNDL